MGFTASVEPLPLLLLLFDVHQKDARPSLGVFMHLHVWTCMFGHDALALLHVALTAFLSLASPPLQAHPALDTIDPAPTNGWGSYSPSAAGSAGSPFGEASSVRKQGNDQGLSLGLGGGMAVLAAVVVGVVLFVMLRAYRQRRLVGVGGVGARDNTMGKKQLQADGDADDHDHPAGKLKDGEGQQRQQLVPAMSSDYSLAELSEGGLVLLTTDDAATGFYGMNTRQGHQAHHRRMDGVCVVD